MWLINLDFTYHSYDTYHVMFDPQIGCFTEDQVDDYIKGIVTAGPWLWKYEAAEEVQAYLDVLWYLHVTYVHVLGKEILPNQNFHSIGREPTFSRAPCP